MSNLKNKRLLATVALYCIFASSAIIRTVEAQVDEKNLPACVNKETCHECIQTPSCAWCQITDHGDKPRCFRNTTLDICPQEYTVNPQIEEIRVLYEELTHRAAVGHGGGGMVHGVYAEGGSYHSHSESGSVNVEQGYYGAGSASGHQKIVQIWPQRVKLNMRINEAYRMEMRYSQAEDYPVDLYYLMDLSKSMEDDKEKLSTLGDKLTQTMLSMTSNFRLGFGSFVDKVLMPYVSTIPKKLEHPCDGCEAPYGFHNHMALDTNTSAFSTEVKNAAVSGNLDAPEGGFDAIMQAIVCRDAIGWRDQARRLLVFSTDAGFHYAGDGKLGGVIAPNDGECHLNSRGYYTESTEQDYPSISQINQKVKENSINVIFAVTQSQISVYEKLSQVIQGSSSAVLSNDSSNVVTLVEQEYKKISSTIEMKDNSTSHVKITYYSACKGATERQTHKCANITTGDIVTFTAEIVVTSCPENPADWNQFIQIYPVGINESLIIDLTMMCSCDCERPGSKGYQEKSPLCSGFGTYKCGICECDPLHDGKTCECSSTDINLDKNNYGCRRDNTTDVECSGHGICSCGKCKCESSKDGTQIFSGKYCECNNFSCERNNQLLCSGHGKCKCGTCECSPEWEGSACECLKSKEQCMPPKGGEICSGHGECRCGECKCKVTEEGRYSGKYCEKCPTCSGRCHELKDCVQCQAYQTGPLKDNCMTNCTLFTPTEVDKIVIDEDKGEQLCMFYDEDDCKFTFKYSEVDDKLKVEALQERECPPKVFMLGIVLGVIAAIVLVGLAILLLWKLLTTIHDRREFARFEKERMNAKWDTGENPIYKQATSTFKNPTYAAGK